MDDTYLFDDAIMPVTYDGATLRKSAERDYESFWAQQARGIHWFEEFDHALDWNPPFAHWFPGGVTNACYNAVDRHCINGNSSRTAIRWEAEDGSVRTITYGQLYEQVRRFANVLRSLGVKKGDRVTIYLPMVPELAVAMLGCARIGAVHTVVFSGFSAASLRERISDSGSKVIVTADGGYRRGSIIDLKGKVDDAVLGLADCAQVEHIVVLQRTRHKINIHPRDAYWHDLMKSVPEACDATPVASRHPLFILYTSGTTGRPKGVLHGTGGYLTHVHATFGWAFGADENDVYFCTADVGWVTGHSYVVYGPLMHGITLLMYEGAPDHPDPLRIWRIIRNHHVSIFYTTPTLLRMLMRHDDADRNGAGPMPGLGMLRLLGTVGEPINPDVWRWYNKRVGRGACPIVDTWWQTETGGMLASPLPAIECVPLKPGSAARPIPGVCMDVLDDEGNPSPLGTRGHLVVRNPWPGMMLTLWGDDDRYRTAYWERYPGAYHAGDYARIDNDGYVWILGRADDVLKVAGHRIGTAELEGCVVSHPRIAESAVCGIPDDLRGESIAVFAVRRGGDAASKKDDEQLCLEITQKIRSEIGPIASPSAVYVVSRLPKTRSGKIVRRLLRSLVINDGSSMMGDTSTLEDPDVIGEIRDIIQHG